MKLCTLALGFVAMLSTACAGGEPDDTGDAAEQAVCAEAPCTSLGSTIAHEPTIHPGKVTVPDIKFGPAGKVIVPDIKVGRSATAAPGALETNHVSFSTDDYEANSEKIAR